MKNPIFNKSIRILIVSILLLAICLQKEKSQPLMIAVFSIWLIITCGNLLWNPATKLVKKCKSYLQNRPLFYNEPVSDSDPSQATELQTESTPVQTTEPAPQKPAMPDESILQHVSLRITEKLRSAYPDIRWEWHTTPVLTSILDGKTFRIVTENMDSFTHADIHFDSYGRIYVEPITVGTFASMQPASAKNTPEAAVPPVEDVRVWYDLVGREVLDKVITELNAGGHSRLIIKENGDIVVTKRKKDCVLATLTPFPSKNYWQELITILTEYQLQGNISNDQITVSWA